MTDKNHSSIAQSSEIDCSFYPFGQPSIDLHDPGSMTLFGAKVRDIFWPGDFIPVGAKESDSLSIVHISEVWEPAQVVLHKKFSSAYLVNAKDVIQSADLMEQLSIGDREIVNRLASISLERLDYANWSFVTTDAGRRVRGELKEVLSELSPVHQEQLSKMIQGISSEQEELEMAS